MAGTLEAHPIPSLIQGVSQQAESIRGTASAEDQENCLNDILDGVVARMGSVVQTDIDQEFNDPFCSVFERNALERYLVVIEDGVLRIFNLVSGVESTITGSISSYLAHTGTARDAFAAVKVVDTLFLANRQVTPDMESATSPARSNDAIAFFRAGSYSTNYRLTITVGGVRYETAYTTPDNSVASNADYIATNQLAQEFKDAIDLNIIPALTGAGHTGFSCEASGSTVIIRCSGATVYQIDTEDGQGDRQFISFRERVRTFTDLPARCFDGYQVAVSGSNDANEDDYYLEYEGGPSDGVWKEVVAPGVETSLDAATMPHVLVNTGLNSWTVSTATWGDRLAGDGDKTSQDPNFIGQNIVDLSFLSGRLVIITEGFLALSRARNGYVFFPDTVQTNLDTAPVFYDVATGEVSQVYRSLVAGTKLQLWGPTGQAYLDSGQDPIRENTTELLPLTNYDYDGKAPPKAYGMGSVVFGSEVGGWVRMFEVFYRGGTADGEIHITGHCPRYLKGSLRHIALGSNSGNLAVLTNDDPSIMYLYQFFNNGRERVQSAWNKLTFPTPAQVVWVGIFSNVAHILVKWNGGCTLEKLHLDTKGDAGELLPLRLDHRVDESYGTHDSGGGYFTVSLPYTLPTGRDFNDFVAVERKDVEDESQRGRLLVFEEVDGSTVRVFSDNPELEFYFGRPPVALRRMSRFHMSDKNGPILPERIVVDAINIAHDRTVSYSVVVRKPGGVEKLTVFTGRRLGDPSLKNNQVKLDTGTFPVEVGEPMKDVEIDLLNGTHFPSQWVAAEYYVRTTKRASR